MEENKQNREKNSGEWMPVFRLLPWILLLPAGALLPRFCSGKTEWMERYAQEVYPAFKDGISALTSLIPVSLAEAAVYALVLGIPLLLLTRLIRVLKGKMPLQTFVLLIVRLAVIAGIVWNLFYVTWGFNYFREPLKNRMELSVRQRPVDELFELTVRLAGKTSQVREYVEEDENGVFRMKEDDIVGCFEQIPQVYAALAERIPVYSGKVTRAKPVSWSRGLSHAGISGIYIGLTAEPNVNVDQPPLLIPEAAAHETAHQLGIASEDEAEFSAMIACMTSRNADIAYSGLADALILCGNALFRNSPERYAEARKYYSEAVLQDLHSYNAYWDAFEGKVEETVTRMNDSYLKHNAQDSGVKSYGESVDMLLAFYERTDFLAEVNAY